MHLQKTPLRGFYRTKTRNAIGRARQRLRLTQRQAADRCGVSLRTYQRAEGGDVLPWQVKRAIEARLLW